MSTEAEPPPPPPQRSGNGRRASDRALKEVLRDSEEQVRALLECAPDAMVVVDSDGAIILVNAQVKALFGYEPEELIGQSVELLVPESSRPVHGRHRAGFHTRPDGRATRLGRELSARRRDGSEFPVEISLSAMRTAAGATVSASIRDITERKRVEAAAAVASRLKSEFVANMSHEIRTPLNGLLGMSELLSDTDLDPTQRHYVEVIGRSGEALARLVDDVLDFSKLEAGKLQLDPFDFDPGAIVDDALAMVSTAAARKKLALVVSIDPGVPALVRSDGGRIRQVLSNLLSNAVKFTAAGEVRLTRECARRESRPASLRGCRHRHRDGRGRRSSGVRPVRPGRCLDHAPSTGAAAWGSPSAATSLDCWAERSTPSAPRRRGAPSPSRCPSKRPLPGCLPTRAPSEAAGLLGRWSAGVAPQTGVRGRTAPRRHRGGSRRPRTPRPGRRGQRGEPDGRHQPPQATRLRGRRCARRSRGGRAERQGRIRGDPDGLPDASS